MNGTVTLTNAMYTPINMGKQNQRANTRVSLESKAEIQHILLESKTVLRELPQ